MAKFYYHPMYTRAEEALLEVHGKRQDVPAAFRVERYLQDRRCLFRGHAGLDVVGDGDVLTVDGHGVGKELPGGAGYMARQKLAVPGGRARSPAWIARQLKKDGLTNHRILIKFFPCLTALETRFGRASTASALARALGYTHVVVQGYAGETLLGDKGRRVNPTGTAHDWRDAYLYRKYYDSHGAEVSVERAREIAGDQVAHKNRNVAVEQVEPQLIDL